MLIWVSFYGEDGREMSGIMDTAVWRRFSMYLIKFCQFYALLVHPHLEFKKFFCYENFYWPWHPVFCCGLVSCSRLAYIFLLWFIIHFFRGLDPVFCSCLAPHFWYGILFSVVVWHPILCYGLAYRDPFTIVFWNPISFCLLASLFLLWFCVPFSVVAWHPVIYCGWGSRFLLWFGILFSVGF